MNGFTRENPKITTHTKKQVSTVTLVFDSNGDRKRIELETTTKDNLDKNAYSSLTITPGVEELTDDEIPSMIEAMLDVIAAQRDVAPGLVRSVESAINKFLPPTCEGGL